MLRLALLTALLHYVSAQPEAPDRPDRLIVDYDYGTSTRSFLRVTLITDISTSFSGSSSTEIVAQTTPDAVLIQARGENFLDTENEMNKLNTYKAGDWIHHGKIENRSFHVESNMDLRMSSFLNLFLCETYFKTL